MRKFYGFLIFLVLANIIPSSYSQEYKNPKMNPDMKGYKIKNFFQLTTFAGVMTPFYYLADNYYTSGNIGFDLSYRINRETALFFEFQYHFLSVIDTAGPNSAYLLGAVGTRFYWRSRGIRSSFFFETATGPYFHVVNSNTILNVTYPSYTETNWGLNAGFGGEIVLTNSLFFTMKGKYNALFSKKGTLSFANGQGGITVRF